MTAHINGSTHATDRSAAHLKLIKNYCF